MVATRVAGLLILVEDGSAPTRLLYVTHMVDRTKALNILLTTATYLHVAWYVSFLQYIVNLMKGRVF